MIAVVGISSSSQASLNQQLTSLGTNLLTVSAGKSLDGKQTKLPVNTAAKVRMIDEVEQVSSTSLLEHNVYRSPLSDRNATGGISVVAADLQLLEVVSGSIRSGTWLNAATASYPSVVLGSSAADRLGVHSPGTQITIGGHLTTVVGILDPVALAPELDTAALIGQEIAETLLGYDGSPTILYQRVAEDSIQEVRGLIGPTISPQRPDEVEVSRPSDALAAKNAADQAFTGLLVGVGSIALLVGGIGVANTMIISVLERRREIGLRRALGATRGHIRAQFLTEALLLSIIGGLFGVLCGAGLTMVMSLVHDWQMTLPVESIVIGVSATLLIGAIAGLYPAIRAARTPPTAALNG